jgi:exodeoxyribonuclease VII large subunit
VRAATPSHAAEIAVRDVIEVRRHLTMLGDHADRAIAETVAERRRRLAMLTEKYGFRRQRDALGPLRQRVDELIERTRAAVVSRLRRVRDRLRAAAQRYGLREWPRELVARREAAVALHDRFVEAAVRGAQERRRRLDAIDDQLRALSPRLVLERGFCIVRAGDGSLVRAAEALSPGERIVLEFSRSEADARVESVRPGGSHGSA